MNTNQLTKHYATLSPDERLPLLIAARNRGDEIEENRLTVTAPPVLYRMGDHCKLHQAFHLLAYFHFMELVHLAGRYQHCLALADAFDDDVLSNRMIDAGNLYGYVFFANLEGWRSFTDHQGIEWDALFRDLPGFDTVQRTQGQYSISDPITQEAAMKLFSKLGEAPPQGIITAELVANSFHKGFRSAMENGNY